MQGHFDIDYDAIERHVRAQFARAVMKDDPYPHVQLDGVLPEDYYDFLLDALPLPQDLGSDNSGALNFAVVEADPHFARMTPSRREIWTEFERRINQTVIRHEMIKLFSPYLSLKFDTMLDAKWPERAKAALGENWREAFAAGQVYQPEGASGGRLLLVTRNFNLAPHVDNATSVLTFLFYMPRDNTREPLGTKMHVVADKENVCRKYRARKNIDVWLVENSDLTSKESLFPYRRNSIAAMLCLPTAVHSISCQEINYCRYLMQTQVFVNDHLGSALFEGWSAKGVGY